MKVEQQVIFTPVTVTIESQEELELLAAALNSSDKTLRENWENMGFGGEPNLNLTFPMWQGIVKLLRD